MIRPFSAMSDFREELAELVQEAREAGLDDAQIAAELNGFAHSASERAAAQAADT